MNLLERVMRTTAFDNCDDVWWRLGNTESNPDGPGFVTVDGDNLHIFVNCSDVFFWGCSDLEEITEENVAEFERAYMDAEEVTENGYESGALLFVARVRGERPQGAYYKYLDQRMWPLFDAAGPKRETGIGNPVEH